MFARVTSYTLLSGSSQILLIAAAIGATIAVGPAAFGVYAVFLSVVAMLSSLTMLRYEVMAASVSSAIEAAWLTRKFARHQVLASATAGCGWLLFGHMTPWSVDMAAMAWFSAVGVAMIALASGLALGQRRNVAATVPRLVYGGLLLPAQLAFLALGDVEALIRGHVVAIGAGAGWAAYQVVAAHPKGVRASPTEGRASSAWFTVAGLINQLGSNMPVQAIAVLFGHAWAGHFALANRVLGAPLQLVGNAVSTALTAEFARESGLFQRVTRYCFLVALLFAALLLPLTSPGIAQFFWPKWLDTASVMFVMVPLFCVRMTAVPAVGMVNARRDGVFLIAWEVGRLALLLVLWAACASLSAEMWIMSLATGWAVCYAILIMRGRVLAKAAASA